MGRNDARGFRGAFTLIELLVVIAIIALLISILTPALGKARMAGKKLQETAHASQKMIGVAAYTTDYGDKMFPGYLAWDWAHPDPTGGTNQMVPDDLGRLLEGTAVKPFPWRLAPYLDYVPQAQYLDKERRQTLMELMAGSRSGGNAPDTITPFFGSFEYQFSLHPTLGMNTTFFGGDWLRGAFRYRTAEQYGNWYIGTISATRNPSRVLTFASARDVSGGQIVNGSYRVEPPYRVTNGGGGWLRSGAGAQSVNFDRRPLPGYARGYFDPLEAPADYGNVDFRWEGKAVTAYVDGHVKCADVKELFDMRVWSDQAPRARWVPRDRTR